MKINLENMEMSTLFDGANLPPEDEGDFDGMKVHSSGNIFTSGPGGLLIISPQGKLLGKIDFGQITNCAFDENEEYLDLNNLIADLIALERPINPLCQINCEGLCITCGINKNKSLCSCRIVKKNTVWDKLKDFKVKED